MQRLIGLGMAYLLVTASGAWGQDPPSQGSGVASLSSSAVTAKPEKDASMLYEWKPEDGKRIIVVDKYNRNNPRVRLPGKLPDSIPAGSTLTARTAATTGTTVRIFFGNGYFPEANSLSMLLTADGQMHDYVFRFPFPIYDTPIRLDPSDAIGQVEIECVVIRTVPSRDPRVGAFFMDRVLPRSGRPERVCALFDNTGKEPAEATATLAVPAGVQLLGPAAQEVKLGVNEVRLLSWQVQAAASAVATLTLNLSLKDEPPQATELQARFSPPVKQAKIEYVPPPIPAKTDYLIGAMYFPGWKEGLHYGWKRIVPFPERKPALGWYDENNPEVTDWEIKFAVEHGISFFLYCWYRNPKNEGKPMTVGDTYLSHAIHEGLFNARYRDQFKFCIMWEDANMAGVSSMDDMMNNLLPFWIKEYFSKPNYMKIDNKPLLFVYSGGKGMGKTAEERKAGWDMVREACVKAGLGGILVFGGERSSGFDSGFVYCKVTDFGPFGEKRPDQTPCIPTLSMGWNPAPWGKDWEHGWRLNGGGRLHPDTFRYNCITMRKIMDSLPAEDPGHRLLLLDNWNEWGEGHYMSPHRQFGFGYLDAIREVFTQAPADHEDLTPDDVGLGPYDSRFQEVLQKEKLGPSDAVIREMMK